MDSSHSTQQQTSESEQLILAAQYVRMSTDHQQYSTLNQSDKIQEYAQKHNIKIIKTYVDGGKSGLSLNGRVGLRSQETPLVQVLYWTTNSFQSL